MWLVFVFVTLLSIASTLSSDVPTLGTLEEEILAMLNSRTDDVDSEPLKRRVEPVQGEIVEGKPFPIRPRYLPSFNYGIAQQLAVWTAENETVLEETAEIACGSLPLSSPWPGANVALVSPNEKCEPERVKMEAEQVFYAMDDQVIATGRPQRIDVLRNDRGSNTWIGGVCEEHQNGLKVSVDDENNDLDSRVGDDEAFVDVFPLHDWVQKQERTSPNCLFPYYDRNSRRWDDKSFCILELLTGGVAVGDYDGDGRLDVFFTAMDRPSLLLRNMGCEDGSESCADKVRFADVTEEAGFPTGLSHHREDPDHGFVRMNGARFADVDGDGDLDLLTGTMGEQRFYFWENDGTGHFQERAVETGLDIDRRRPEEYVPFHDKPRPWSEVDRSPMTSSFTIAAADTDGDSLPEFYSTEWFTRLEMTDLNAFEDLEQHPNPTRGFPNEMTTSRLLQNNGISARAWAESGGKAFRDRTSQAGIFGRSHKSIVKWSDPQTTLSQYNVILQEAGVASKKQRIRFLEELAQMVAFAQLHSLLEDSKSVETSSRDEENRAEFEKHRNHFLGFGFSGLTEFGATFVDLDLDGFQDLVITGDFGTTQLYMNRGTHGEVGGGKSGSIIFGRGSSFRPMFFSIPTDSTDSTMGCAVGDFDNDGLPDVFFTSISVKEMSESSVSSALFSTFETGGFDSGFQGNHLYRGVGRRNFADISRLGGVTDAGWAWGATFWDYDNDGDLDLIVVNGLDDPETTDDDFAINQPTRMFENTIVSTDVGKRPSRSKKHSRRSSSSDASAAKERVINKEINKGAGPSETLFVEKAESLNLVNRNDGRSVVAGDFGGDGKLDIVTANHASSPEILLNKHGAPDEYAWLRVHVIQPTIGDMVRAGLVTAAVNAQQKGKREQKPLTYWILSFAERILPCLAGDAKKRIADLIQEAKDPDGVWASIEPTLEAAIPASLSARFRSASGARVWVRTKHTFERGGYAGDVPFHTSPEAEAAAAASLPPLPLEEWMKKHDVKDSDGLSAINAFQTGTRLNQTARLPPAFGGAGVQYREVASQAAFMGQSDETPHFGLGPGVQRVASVTVQWPWMRASRTFWDVPVRQTLRVSPPVSAIARFGAALLAGTCPEALPPALRRALVPITSETPRKRDATSSPTAIEPLHTNWILQRDAVPTCSTPHIDNITSNPKHGTATIIEGRYIHYEPHNIDDPQEDSLQYSVGNSIATLHIRKPLSS